MQLQQLSRLIAMDASVTIKKSKRQKVEQRVRDCVCLVCDEEAAKRGLCHAHYQTFLRRQREAADPASFEVNAIREGLILQPQQMRAIKRDDPFASC